jgi:putative Flp pilus-assembly TadE/G-like protein
MPRRHEAAQVLVVFAITAASLLAVVGLLYSFGLVLAQRRSAQTAADSASLSGTWQVLRELASDNRSDAAVLSSIVQFATANGVASDGTPADATNLSAVYVDASGATLSGASVGGGGTFPVAARGVRVTVKSQVQTILPGFLQVWQVLVQNTGAATARPTTAPVSAGPVVPIGVSASDALTAYSQHTLYDLFARGLTLNFAANGAPTFGATATNEQYWSDGQHSGAWQLSQPTTVSLADAAYHDSIAAGLNDNVRRQALLDASGAAYALVSVPIYDTATSSSAHVIGFAQLKVRHADISVTSALGLFVPYPAAAWGTPVAPSPDTGAALIGLVP